MKRLILLLGLCAACTEITPEGGTSSGASATSFSASSSSAGPGSSALGSSSLPASSSAASGSSIAASGSSGGSSSSNDCGPDDCPSCPAGYAPADECLNGSWQCACALGSGSSTSSSGSIGTGSSGGGTSSASCGPPIPCPACPPRTTADEQCLNGQWICGCSGGTTSSVTSTTTSASSSSGGSTSSFACGPNSCPPCGPGCSPFDICGPMGWQCACACGGPGSVGSGSSSSSGGSTAACLLDGGPSFIGDWSGTGDVTETFGNVARSGYGSDVEDVTEADGGYDFQYFDAELVNCTLLWTPTGSASATLATPASCADAAGGTWTFQSGSASLDATGCVMTEQTAGTIADPGSGPGTFSSSSTLDLQ